MPADGLHGGGRLLGGRVGLVGLEGDERGPPPAEGGGGGGRLEESSHLC